MKIREYILCTVARTIEYEVPDATSRDELYDMAIKRTFQGGVVSDETIAEAILAGIDPDGRSVYVVTPDGDDEEVPLYETD